MSFYRTFIAAAAIGLASVAFAAETNTDATQNNTTQPTATTQSSGATQAEKLNVNKATAKELAKVKGLNMTKAKAIVTYRKKNGDFKSLDDLKEVTGFKKMTEETMKNIQDQLTIG